MKKSVAVKAMLKTFEDRVKASPTGRSSHGVDDMRRRILDTFARQTDALRGSNQTIKDLRRDITQLKDQMRKEEEEYW